MKKSDIFFGDGIFEQSILIFLYLAGLFFLGMAVYALILLIQGVRYV